MSCRSLHVIAAGILFAISIPLLAFSAVIEKLGRNPRPGYAPADLTDSQGACGIGEFAFEHAIEAYEELIDSTCTARRA